MITKEVKWSEIKDFFLENTDAKLSLDDVILIQDNAHIKDDMLKFIEETKHADVLQNYKLGITRTIFFGGEPGLGKALTLDSKLLSNKGWIRMGDIQLGDVLFDSNGNPTRVTGIYPQGVRPIYKISFNDGTSLEVDEDHLNYVYKYSKDKKQKVYETIKTKDLIPKFEKYKNYKEPEYYRVDTPCINFDKQDVPMDPYLLGCLIGDGSLSIKGSWGFSNIDKDILNRVNLELNRLSMKLVPNRGSNCDYAIRHVNGYNYKLSWKGKEYTSIPKLRQDMISHGVSNIVSDSSMAEKINGNSKNSICKELNKVKVLDNTRPLMDDTFTNLIISLGLNVKANKKHIPKEYLYNSKEVRLEILRGLMDTDGTIGLTDRGGCSIEFSTCSKQLSEDFAFLVRSLGFVDSIKVRKTGYKKDNKYIECQDSYEHILKWPKDVVPFYCKRKVERMRPRQTEPVRKIIDIKQINNQEAQCITVDSPLHTYIATDFIPTHNTFCAQCMACELGYPIHILDVGEILKDGNGLERMNMVFNYVTNPKNQPCILFLDECDSIAKSRENAKVDEATKKITNLVMQVLNEQNRKIDSRLIVFAASNYTTGLDAAFMTRFMIQEFFMLPTDYIPFIEMEVKKNRMFNLVYDMTGEDIRIVNKNARIAKYSIRELNAAVTRAEKDEIIRRSDNNLLDGDVIPLKLSAIMRNIVNTPKVNLGSMRFDEVKNTDKEIDFDAPINESKPITSESIENIENEEITI